MHDLQTQLVQDYQLESEEEVEDIYSNGSFLTKNICTIGNKPNRRHPTFRM